jgi:hypothetical protein
MSFVELVVFAMITYAVTRGAKPPINHDPQG